MENVDFLIPPASRGSQNIPQVDESDFLVTLMAMAGHDLRQPLQLITSAHDIITTMPLAKHERQELAHAAAAVRKLARMLDQLIEVVQLHEGGRDDLAAPVPLGPILADLAAEFAASARLKGVHFPIPNSQGVVLSHPVLLTAMLRNLVRNAIDYTPAGGSVSITSRQRGPELHITVRDTGRGIHAAALSKIFNAFERADESRPDGFGLGLFIVKRAGDLLGHSVDVQSIEGRGSCFTIRAIRADCSRLKLVA